MDLDEFIKICRDIKYEKGLFNPNTKYAWMKDVFEVGNAMYYINNINKMQSNTAVLDRIKKDKKFAAYFKNYIYENN